MSLGGSEAWYSHALSLTFKNRQSISEGWGGNREPLALCFRATERAAHHPKTEEEPFEYGATESGGCWKF
jgi:hypothetical protein